MFSKLSFRQCLAAIAAILLLAVVGLQTLRAQTPFTYSENWAPSNLCKCDPPPEGPACYWQPYSIPSQQRYFMAQVKRVVDGDTIDVMVYLGLEVWKEERLRLPGIDAWEIRGEERPKGLVAKEYVEHWVNDLGVDRYVILETNQDRGKYGRLIADLVECGHYLTDDLVNAGHAVRAKY